MTCINLLLVSCVVPICWATLALRGVRYPGSGHDMLEAVESIVASLSAAHRRPREIPPHDAETHIQLGVCLNAAIQAALFPFAGYRPQISKTRRSGSHFKVAPVVPSRATSGTPIVSAS